MHRYFQIPFAATLSVMLMATAPAELDVSLHLIDSVPAQTSGTGLGPPFFSGGSVYYHKADNSGGGSAYGLYRDGSAVVVSGEIISGNAVNNISPTDTDGSVLLFRALSNHATGSPTTFKDTLNIVSGGTYSRLLSIATTLPGYPNPHPGNPIGPGTVDSGLVAFLIREAPFTNPPQPSALATIPSGGGSVNVFAKEGDLLPNNAGTLRKFDHVTLPYVHAGRVVFVANGSVKKGIYEWNGSNLTTVVDSAMTPPPGGNYGTFTVGQLAKHGNDYAFMTGGTNSATAIYKIINGQVSLVGNTQTPVPGGVGNFLNYSDVSIRNGKLLFHAYRNNQFSPPLERGIYTDISGQIEPIIDMRTDFGGKTPTQMLLPKGSAWVGDGRTYVTVAFTDKSAAIYRVDFAVSAPQFESYVIFNGSKSGTFFFQTKNGFNYTLFRTTDFVGKSQRGFTIGNGGLMSLPFDDTSAGVPRAFFYVQESPP